MRIVALLLFTISVLAHAQEKGISNPQLQNIPYELSRAFYAQELNRVYKFSFHINPFYLRGDFDGDGKPDFAAFITKKDSPDKDIVIFNSGSQHIFVIGEGTDSSPEHFNRIDNWQVIPVGSPAQPNIEVIRKLHEECIHMGVFEDGGGVLYWNGKEYIWQTSPRD